MKFSNPLINSGSTLLDILSPGEKPVRWNAVPASKMAKHCRNSVPAYKNCSGRPLGHKKQKPATGLLCCRLCHTLK